jgi:hypothetical protein
VPTPANFRVDPLSEGRAGLRFGATGAGFIDEHGKIVIEPDFQDLRGFHEGLAAVRKGHRYFYIDKNGKEAITLPEDCSYACDFGDGLAAIALGGNLPKTRENGVVRTGSRWAFIDSTGKVVIPPKFFAGKRFPVPPQFHEGLAAVMEAAPSHNFGYIDKSGKWVIEPKYRSAGDFDSGVSYVTERDTDFSRLWNGGREPRGRYGNFDREEALRMFLERNDVFDLKRSQINAFLGKPDKSTAEADSYSISGGCSATSYVEFYYLADRVTKYRLWSPQSEWFDREHPDQGDW